MLRMAFMSAIFFNKLHETVHGTAFQSKQINNFVAQCFGVLTLWLAQHYFYYHVQHHKKYTGNKQTAGSLISYKRAHF
jgi:fatty acid desaturase